MLFKIKGNRDYKIHYFNVRFTIILSAFAIFVIYLSNPFLFDGIKQAWADSVIANIIHVGTSPFDIAYDSDNGKMYVADAGSNTVSVINASTHQIIATIPVGVEPFGVAYDSGNKKVYVTNSDGGVSVINASINKVVATISVGVEPFGVAYDSGHGRTYVANSGSNTVSVIATAQSPSNKTITSAVDRQR